MSSVTHSTTRPKVSVIVPLFNHERYVAEAVHSVLAQTYADFELLIINDGSTDGSERVVSEIQDERITYYSQPNQGAPLTINKGIRYATGEYVSILNSDDVYDLARLATCVALLDSNPSLSAVFSHVDEIDDAGRIIGHVQGPDYVWQTRQGAPTFESDRRPVLDLLAGNFLLTTSNLFCRRRVFDDVGYFASFRYAHDYEFFLRLALGHRVSVIDRPLLKYRRHASNTINENEAAVHFEVALILASLLMKGDFRALITSAGVTDDAALKFYNSINTFGTDRILMTLCAFALARPEGWADWHERLATDAASPFRRACIDSVRHELEHWRASRRAWHDLRHTQERLAQLEADTSAQLADRELRLRALSSELSDQLRDSDMRIRALSAELTTVVASWSYRIGRVFTWPARVLAGAALAKAWRRKP